MSKNAKKQRKVKRKADAMPAVSAGNGGRDWWKLASWAGFVLVLLFCVSWTLWYSYLVDAVTVRLCADADKDVPAELRMPVFLSEIAFDGYVWNRHAEKLGENGQWRLRFTDFDNAPAGREVHWNSAFAWYLRALGEIRRVFHEEPLRHAIFRMSIWANPILLVFLIGVFAPLCARRFGPLCGSVIALGMVAVPTFFEGFMPAYPDHHGIIAFALFGLLFGIASGGAGWVQACDGEDFGPARSLRQARQGMVFSGICGAVGLWVSALSTTMVLGAIGVAVIVSILFRKKPGKDAALSYHPEMWKIWAAWGAGTSLVLYLLEYFPSHVSLRLEVNHPLYSLAWLGGGWALAALTDWLYNRGGQLREFPWRRLVWPTLAVLPLPLIILLGGPEFYIPKDPFMSRLWKNIAELLPLTERIRLGGLTWKVAIGWYPVFVLAAVVMQFLRRVGPGTKSLLVFLSAPIFLITVCQFYQVRWGMLVGPLYIALAAVVVPLIWRIIPSGVIVRVIAGLVLVASVWVFMEPAYRTLRMAMMQYSQGSNVQITPGQALALLHRKMASAILKDAGGEPVVLLSSPNSSCLLSALGGFRTIGTLYWENVNGLKAAAKALNAESEDEALEFMRNRGVTHISFLTWENFIEPYFRILHPASQDFGRFMRSFGKRAFFDKVIPLWGRPLVFPPNDITKGLNQSVLMLRVVPGQSEMEAKLHLARYLRFAEDNPVAAEIQLKEITDENPSDSSALLELADLYMSSGRYSDATNLLVKALPLLSGAMREQVVVTESARLESAGCSVFARRLREAASDSNDGVGQGQEQP